MENNKSLLPVILISVALVASAAIISRTGVYIKNTGGVESNGRVSNTISVSGDGRVYAKPDMVTTSVSVTKIAPTSKEALDKVNQLTNQVFKILKDNGVPDSDITTQGLSIHTEYDYSTNKRRIIGQRASQNISIKIKKIDEKATKAAKVIDELSVVDDIEMYGITFDIEDKAKFFTDAREAAYKKAKQKADELAKMSGVKLGKPVSISDSTYDIAPAVRYSNVMELKSQSAALDGAATSISTGEMGISANLSILWSIE